MKHCRVIFLYALLATLAGCSAGPKVPDNAVLLYYGNSTFSMRHPLPGPGQLYLYDDSAGKTISVVTVEANDPVSYSGLPDRHYFRLYFVPRESAPSTNASVGN